MLEGDRTAVRFATATDNEDFQIGPMQLLHFYSALFHRSFHEMSHYYPFCAHLQRERTCEGQREGGREREREEGRKGGREGGRKRDTERREREKRTGEDGGGDDGGGGNCERDGVNDSWQKRFCCGCRWCGRMLIQSSALCRLGFFVLANADGDIIPHLSLPSLATGERGQKEILDRITVTNKICLYSGSLAISPPWGLDRRSRPSAQFGLILKEKL